MKKILLVSTILALTGCASQISKNTVYNEANEDGLVALSLDTPLGIEALSFAKLDPESCRVTSAASFDGRNYVFGISGDTHLMDTFEPGVWIIDEATFIYGNTKTIVKYEKGALAFNVKPGEFIHVGKINLTQYNSTITKPDEEKLSQFLEEYKNITVAPKLNMPWITPYTRKRDEVVEGCRNISEMKTS